MLSDLSHPYDNPIAKSRESFGPGRRSPRDRVHFGTLAGFTIVELLVVIVVVAIMMSLLIPAVNSARAAARRAQCQTNMRSIGHALLAFESSTGALPAGRDQSQMADHSWATQILPNLEEQSTFDRYDWKKSWWDIGDNKFWPSPWNLEYVDGRRKDIQGNLQVAATNIPVFQCPETNHNFKGAIDYGGNYGSTLTGLEPGFSPGQAWDSGMLLATNLAFMKKTRRRGVRLEEVTDGQSHTFLVLEDAGREPQQGGMWANGHNCLSPNRKFINLERSNEIYSDHWHIAHALMGDGSVMVLTDDMDAKVIGAMTTRNGADSHHSLQ